MRTDHVAVDYRGKYRQCILAAACILGACFSLMFAPLANYSRDEGSTASGIILSIVTWAFVLSAAVLIQKLWAFTSYRARRDRTHAGERYKLAKPGLLTFAANTEGVIAEILLVAGIVIWILRAIGVIHFDGPLRMLQYSLTFSGLLLHCFFNGKNYIYIKRKAKKEGKRGAHA